MVAAPYLIKVTFGLSSEVYGVAEGLIALGMIIGGIDYYMETDEVHIKRVHHILYLTSVSMALMGLSVFLFQRIYSSSFVSVVLFTIFGMVIMGVLGIANVLSATYLYEAAESSMLGKVLAFGSAFAVLCIPLGQILFGGLIELFVHQIYWLIYIAASLVFGVTLLVRWNVLQIKEENKSS